MILETGDVISSVFLKSRHLARVTDEETLFYGTDHQGSTVLVTDESGTLVWTSEASPFGDAVVRKTGDRDDLALKYTGKDLNEDTGLYYFNARWYDADTGRFISEDPARDGANWYVYTPNNPLKFIDPTGLRPEEGPQAGDGPEPDNEESPADDPTPEIPTDDGNGNQGKDDNDIGDDNKKKDDSKPDDPEAQVPKPVTPGQGEIPEELAEILRNSGVVIEEVNPTIDDLNEALNNLEAGEKSQGIKDLVNETLNNLKNLDPAAKEKIEGGLMMAAGIGIVAGSIAVAVVAPVPAAATGLTTGAGIAAYGFSRLMNAGSNEDSASENLKDSVTPPMAELGKIDVDGIR